MAVISEEPIPSSASESLSESAQAFARAEHNTVTRLVLVISFLLIFGMAARTPLDTDMWWHLRSGEETLRLGHPLLNDLSSFTRQGAHWINHSWLSQVGMALLFRWGGYLALSLAMSVLAVLSMFFVFLQCEGPVFLKSAALLLGSVVASVVWVPRPQIASLALMALVGYLLYLYKWHGRDILWAMLPVFILWSNLHGGYVIGLLLIAAMLSGEVINHILGLSGDHILSWKAILRLGAWALACLVVVLLNPNGLDTWLIPFRTVNVGALQQLIPEWASPDFHSLLQQTLLWLLLAVFAAVGLSGRMMDGSDLVAVLGFAALALVARRNYGPFALVAVPVLTRYASAGFESWRARAPWLSRLVRSSKVVVPPPRSVQVLKKTINMGLVGLLALVVFGKLYVVTQPVLVEHYLTDSYPVRATQWLETNRPGARVLNEYNWGGYLQWAAPNLSIFVDGRTDLFGDAVIGDWMNAVQAGPGWQSILDRYGVNLVMLAPDRPLLGQLSSAGWQLLYQDSQAVIYTRVKGR